MRFLRTISLLLCTLCLLSPSAALAQSAGDEQYADPFGETTEQPQDSGTGTTAPESEADPDATLTDEPQITPDVTAPPAVGSGDLQDVPQDTTNRPQRLADTGLDTRLFLALGVSLLLAGIGLRLRTIPERF